ncbi:YhjD/YihY/BrkB family envelope integrity protein [Aquihabitans sp. McL0605]|uniref:YhjD/YihY/BrkB family envelope integrity protein n=1 Tax=Aquihabitans sp. McL0605 TaxID=3415671 RepID=UPI003CEE7254
MDPDHPTDHSEAPPPPEEARPTRTARLRQQATELGERAATELEQRRRKQPLVELAVTYYDRDKEAIASVLGAAIALRLYLFIIPVVAMIVGLAIALLGKDSVDRALTSNGISGTLAHDISSAASGSRGAGLALFIVALWLTLWAGRSLTKVLAASAGRAWRMDAKETKATMIATGAITGTVTLMFGATLVLNRLRDKHGFAADTTSWAVTGVLFAGAWFLVTWALPRKTTDPGALLPGAAFMGVTLTALQWFMQFYLPDKITRANEFAGQLGMSMAALGYLFLMGRLIAVSFVIDAVVFERLGSLSRLVFAVPVIRAIPRRYPAVARFFDLNPSAEADPGSPPASPAAPA